MKNILLIHGPNLNRLGRRDVEHYGELTLTKLAEYLENQAIKRQMTTKAFQSNHEGALIDFIQENSAEADAIIINPGAFTHYSYALYDALLDSKLPCVEVHLSDVNNREKFRSISVTAPACITSLSGKQEKTYVEALDILHKQFKP